MPNVSSQGKRDELMNNTLLREVATKAPASYPARIFGSILIIRWLHMHVLLELHCTNMHGLTSSR